MKKLIVISLFFLFSLAAFSQSTQDSTLQLRLDSAGHNLKGFATFQGFKMASFGLSAVFFISSQGVTYDLLKNNLQGLGYTFLGLGLICEAYSLTKAHKAGKLLITPTGVIYKFGH